MKLIISYCIKFYPEERIDFHILKKLLKTINKSTIKDIEKSISEYLQKQKEITTEMSAYIISLKEKLKKRKIKLNDLKKKYNQLAKRNNELYTNGKNMRNYQSTKKLDIYELFKLMAKIKKVKRNLDNDLKTHIEQVKLNQENTDLDSSIWNEITKQIEFFRHQIKSLRQNLHNKNINNMKIGLPTKKDVKNLKNRLF